MREFAIFDVSKWPVVIIKLKGVPKDLEEFEDYLQGYQMIYEKKQNVKFIIDASEIGHVSLYYISRQAFHMITNQNETEKYVRKVAIILKHQFVKKLLSTLFSLKPPVCHTEVFETFEDANSWL